MTSPIGTKPRAIIIGGSMAGLFSALLLQKAGWCADVYERVGAELASRGAGIVTHPDLWRIIAKAGIRCRAKRTRRRRVRSRRHRLHRIHHATH